MSRRSRRAPGMLLAVVLLLAPPLAQSAPPDHSAQAAEFRAAFREGRLDEARATYVSIFEPVAGAERGLVDEAFLQASRAGDPARPAHRAAAALAGRALDAIAISGVLQSLGAAPPDVEAARSWFRVLASRFPAEAELPRSKRAFPDLTAAEAASAGALLEAETAALALTATLRLASDASARVPSDPGGAAESAAEALGHSEWLRGAFARSGSADAHLRLQGALGTALAAVLDAEPAKVEPAIAEARVLLARHALRTHDASMALAYERIVRAVASDRNVPEARAKFDEAFAAPASEAAPEAHGRVLATFTLLEESLASGAAVDYGVQAATVETGLLEIAFRSARRALAAGDFEAAATPWRVLDAGFRWEAHAHPGSLAVGSMLASREFNEAGAAEALAAARGAFAQRVRDAMDAALRAFHDEASAAASASAAVGSYEPLRESVTSTLGVAVDAELGDELRAIQTAVRERNREAAQASAAHVARLLAQLHAEERTPADLREAIAALRAKLELIREAFDAYLNEKGEGNAEGASARLSTARAHVESAQREVNRSRALLEASDAKVTGALDTRLRNLLAFLAEPGETYIFKVEIGSAFGLLHDLSRPLDPNPEPGGFVSVIVGEPRGLGDGVFETTVSLGGLPANGSSWKLKVSFNPALLKLQDVEVRYGDVRGKEVHAEAGIARITGETVGASPPTVEVARLMFRPTVESATVHVKVEAEELFDGAKQRLVVAEVKGGAIKLPVPVPRVGLPAPGLPFLLLALGMAAVAASRLRR